MPQRFRVSQHPPTHGVHVYGSFRLDVCMMSQQSKDAASTGVLMSWGAAPNASIRGILCVLEKLRFALLVFIRRELFLASVAIVMHRSQLKHLSFQHALYDS